MTEARTIHMSKLMAATSVLGLALGMTALAADNASTQIKGETTQTTTQIKGHSNQLKLDSIQHKGVSTQIKLPNAVAVQHKGDSIQIKGRGTNVGADEGDDNAGRQPPPAPSPIPTVTH